MARNLSWRCAGAWREGHLPIRPTTGQSTRPRLRPPVRGSVGASKRLGHHVIDEAVLEVLGRGEVEGIGGRAVGFVVGHFPKDGCTALGGNDGVPAVLEHGHPVGDRDPQRTARTTFTNDARDNGGLEPTHFTKVEGDGLGLPAFLGLHAGVGTWSVNQAHNGQPELLCQLHLVQCFAISLRVSTAKVAANLLLGGAAFLVANDHHLALADPAKPTHDGWVVTKLAIAVQLAEVAADHLDVVPSLRTRRVTRNPNGVPRRKAAVDLPQHGIAAGLELRQLFDHAIGVGQCPKGGNLVFELFDGFVEGQGESVSGGSRHVRRFLSDILTQRR